MPALPSNLRRQLETVCVKARDLAEAGARSALMNRAVDAPEKVARGQPPVWEKIAAAVGTTIAVSLTKKLIDRTWNQP